MARLRFPSPRCVPAPRSSLIRSGGRNKRAVQDSPCELPNDPMAGDGAGGAIDATSVRILHGRWSGGYGWAWRRVPQRRAADAVIRVDGPSPIVKTSPSISLTTLSRRGNPVRYGFTSRKRPRRRADSHQSCQLPRRVGATRVAQLVGSRAVIRRAQSSAPPTRPRSPPSPGPSAAAGSRHDDPGRGQRETG